MHVEELKKELRGAYSKATDFLSDASRILTARTRFEATVMLASAMNSLEEALKAAKEENEHHLEAMLNECMTALKQIAESLKSNNYYQLLNGLRSLIKTSCKLQDYLVDKVLKKTKRGRRP